MLLPLAQIQTVDTGTFIENNRAISDAVREGLKQTWIDAFKSPLYDSIAFVGATIAVMFIGLWTAQFLRQHLGEADAGLARGLTELLFPFALVLLLANPTTYGPSNGPMLGSLTLGAHDLMNEVSDFVLSKLSNVPGSQPITEAGVKTFAQSTASTAITDCAKLPEQSTRTECLLAADEKIRQILNNYLSTTAWAQPLYFQLQEQIRDALDNPSDYGNSNWVGRVFGGLGSSVQPIFSQAILGLTMAIGAAFIIALEVVQLITGLVGPLFLGISLLPVPGTPWTSWLINYFGISFVNICYKIMVGYTAITMLNAGPSDPLIYPLIISIFGVVFAILLAAGGGISLFSAIARTGAQLATKL